MWVFWNHVYLCKAAVINKDCECYWFSETHWYFTMCVVGTLTQKSVKVKIRLHFWSCGSVECCVCVYHIVAYRVWNGSFGIYETGLFVIMPVKFIQCQKKNYLCDPPFVIQFTKKTAAQQVQIHLDENYWKVSLVNFLSWTAPTELL